MAFEPEYGEPLVLDDERGALTSEVREILGEPVRGWELQSRTGVFSQFPHRPEINEPGNSR